MNHSEHTLTFPSLTFGRRQRRWTLADLLQPQAPHNVGRTSSNPENKGAQLGRDTLVRLIYEEINGSIAAGGSRLTAYKRICATKRFFKWSDTHGYQLNLNTVEDTFLKWVSALIDLQRTQQKIKASSVHNCVAAVSVVLEKILEKSGLILSKTNLRRRVNRKNESNRKGQKQNLEQTFEFGSFLMDICTLLNHDVIMGSLPVTIRGRNGATLKHWSGLVSDEKLSSTVTSRAERERRSLRQAWEAERSHRTRYPLINLRIEAELLLFIGETGMNLAQAFQLKLDRFHYTSHNNGYEVREYKARKSAEVAFEMSAEYKHHFEDFLAWRDRVFTNSVDERLFPIIRNRGGTDFTAPRFLAIKSVCTRLEIAFFLPRQLRRTRINWILRRSQDPVMTAEIAQHTQQTLLSAYHEPHLQSALIDITKFHNRLEKKLQATGPGGCTNGIPTPVSTQDAATPEPDCISPAGCLFCAQQRDLDTLDYVWSLTTFRYLKMIELSTNRFLGVTRGEKLPARISIDKIDQKLRFFEFSSPQRQEWLTEAKARVNEEWFHPAWEIFIKLSTI